MTTLADEFAEAEIVPRFHPPLTLGPAERAIVECLPFDRRQCFEGWAAKLEFLDRVPMAEAEARALEIVIAQTKRGATK